MCYFLDLPKGAKWFKGCQLTIGFIWQPLEGALLVGIATYLR